MADDTTPRLDDEQRAAVMADARFVRVRAGAGTGKTTCLAARVRFLVQVQNVQPRDLCVVTFSKRASEEIKRRVGPIASDAFIGTIHALGYRILQFERLGKQIADERKRSQFILRAIKATGCRDALAYVKAKIARAKAFGVGYPADVAEVGAMYEQILHDEEGMWDFDDLVLEPTKLLAQYEETRLKWLRRFAHVIIDEGQDTSECQWDLIEHLVGVSTGLYVVGDPGQSIYSWRGAARDGMLESLERRFGHPFVEYTISQNYRSRGQIITTANRVLHGKKEHVTVAQARVEGEPVLPIVVGGTWKRGLDESAEKALLLLAQAKIPMQDVVVLGRTHAVLGAIEGVCVKLGLPYLVAGGFSFYDRAEIKDVLAHLEYAAGVDREIALDRFYNRPSRYLGRVWLDLVLSQGGWTRWEAEGPKGFRWTQRYMTERADELWAVCQQLKRYGAQAPVTDVLHYVLNGAVGYRAWARKDGLTEQEASEDNDVEENLKALVEGATRRQQSVGEFVAFVDQCRRHPKRVASAAGAVTLSTIHRAKGLEWPIVVLIGLEEGILPHKRGDAEGEERRLYYVAVSRARDALVLAVSGDPRDGEDDEDDAFLEGTPSRYVLESIAAAGLGDVLPRPLLNGPEEGADDDTFDAEYTPETPLLPAPERGADRESGGDGRGDDVRDADNPAGGGGGHPGGSPGDCQPGHGIESPGGTGHRAVPGIPGDVERDE